MKHRLIARVHEINETLSTGHNRPRSEVRQLLRELDEAQSKLFQIYEGMLKDTYPLIESEAFYERAILSVIGEDGFKRLRISKRLECCGVIYGERLYVLRGGER